MRSADEWAIDLLQMPSFAYAILAAVRQPRDARSLDGVQLHFRPELSPYACSTRVRSQSVAKYQRIYMALWLDRIRSISSCLGLLPAEEKWLRLGNWGAGRDRIRCDSSDCGSCTVHIST